jgi:hypothetical protein
MLDLLNLDRLTEVNLQALVDAGATEGRELDFKRDAYGTADADKREFLADISAFANTSGGHIIIGIDETAGVASALVGIAGNSDTELLRLEQIVRAGLQPRVSGMRMVPVALAGSRYAIVIRIPRSWSGPHRVIAQGSNKFWARDARGKYEPDVDELRRLFAIAPSISEKIRDFRFERVARVSAGDTPVRLADGRSCLIIHIIPFQALAGTVRHAVGSLYEQQTHFRPITTSGYTPRINLNGFISVTPGNGDPVISYAQVWRTGQIEILRSPIVRERESTRIVFSSSIEENVINCVKRHMVGLRALNISPPYAVFVSMTGVKSAFYDPPESFEDHWPFEQQNVHSSEVIIDEPIGDNDIPTVLKPIFDEFANCTGSFGSRHYDSSGKRRRST